MSKIIIYSDFDNTISNYDILDKIITDKYSYEKYKEAENLLLLNEMKYENYLFDFFQGIEYDLNDISNNAVDSTFNAFYNWTLENKIDFYVVSSGFKKIIKHLIPYVDESVIFGNDIKINNDKWEVKLFDEANHSSTNKNNIIKLVGKPDHKTIFIGDGLTDFKVVGHVDYLFCKKDSLLHTKCINEKHDHVAFNDFGDILNEIKKLLT
jgi:HAD superfamily phosphoserine phosphatase-like hydrolase